MKVYAVLNYQKSVIVDIPDVNEDLPDGSRNPDWPARQRVIDLAAEAVEKEELEWTYSTFHKETTEKGPNAWEVMDGQWFELEEWFDN